MTRLAAIPAWARDPAALAGAGAVVVIAAAVWLVRRWRRPSPEELERLRRLRIHGRGRIANGEILEMLPLESDASLPPTLVYQYEVGGVTYQVSQALHLVPVELDPTSWIPGWPVQVKFDPSNPGNSIVVCEHWSGLARTARAQSAASG